MLMSNRYVRQMTNKEIQGWLKKEIEPDFRDQLHQEQARRLKRRTK